MIVPKNILFVDDEPNILAGLKRMLRSMRAEMSFYFAENSTEAQQYLAENAIDIVVADMRMPGMDGASLLAFIQKQYPQITRIMLTGHADDESVLRTVEVAHQFLTKPIEANTLKQTLQRSAALQDMMNSKALKSLVAGLGTLPSLPETYAKLEKQLRQPDCCLADVADIIEKDLAMSAKILQLVNSAFFGLYTHVDSPARAVNLLGLDTIKSLVLGLGIFAEMPVKSGPVFKVTELWHHSMMTAAFARAIASSASDSNDLAEQAFISGLLHDVGKLLLFANKQDAYEQAILQAREKKCPLQDEEQTLFGACHGEVGAYLIGLWGLPGPVVEGLMFHHRLHHYPEPGLCPALIVHIADVLYYQLEKQQDSPPALAYSTIKQAGLSDHLDQWTDICAEILARGEKDG